MRTATISLLWAMAALGLPWPHAPMDTAHHIGNSWGNYQNYGSAYCHNGQDIMTAALAPTLAIKPGYVKKVWLGGSPMYNGVTVGDSAGAAFCSGFMYYHIDNTTIRVQEGDTIQVGDTLGLIATWSVANFHHDHFSKNHNSGVIWQDYGAFYKNPLIELSPDDDSIFPNFLDAYTGQRFAICRNNTSNYQSKDSVYGTVDLICRLEERINHRLWKVAVYRIDYLIRDTLGNTVVPRQLAVQMSDSIDGYTRQQSRVVYKQDATCPTYCNYDSLARKYYYIFTNTDNDSIVEWEDSLAGWNTTAVPDGAYWVKVFASDEYGNTATDSMLLKVRNNLVSRHDVGATAIAAPAAQVDSGAAVTPACTVYNFGTFTETYTVRLRIGTGYDTTAQVSGHAAGTSRAVAFPGWTANWPRGSYAVSCSTQLAGDTTPGNDRRIGSVLVAVHDVGAIAIVAPTGTVDSGASLTPQSTVRNYGNAVETFAIIFTIGDGYSRTIAKTVAPGADSTFSFTLWTPRIVGTWVTRCSTRLTRDFRPANDAVQDSVTVVPVQAVVEAARLPTAFRLLPPTPNPAGGRAAVRYDLSKTGRVSVLLYDAGGRLAATLVDSKMEAGSYTACINAGSLAEGVYWVKFRAGDHLAVQKLVIER